MARKPDPTSSTTAPRQESAPERPWLKSYPPGVAWEARFRPALMGSLLDRAVQAYGPRPCTYFMGKRLSFAEIGDLSDRAAKGLQAMGVARVSRSGFCSPTHPHSSSFTTAC